MKTIMGLPGVVLACGVLAAMPAMAADGPALYKENCAKCHGDTGHADNFRGYLYFARNFTSAKWQAANSDADIMKQINRGPRIMPSFEKSLTLEERQALVQVIRGFAPAK